MHAASPNQAKYSARHLSTAPSKPLRPMWSVGIARHMTADRIASAVTRIEAALARIEAVRSSAASQDNRPASGSARVVELVNVHEKLREQVSESLRELDDLLAKLED